LVVAPTTPEWRLGSSAPSGQLSLSDTLALRGHGWDNPACVTPPASFSAPQVSMRQIEILKDDLLITGEQERQTHPDIR
jgi:hypothetical protein